MPEARKTIETLRAALEASPDNVPLREHLADTLLRYGYAEEAETEYREALRQQPESESLKVGLANAFHSQGKNGPALVIVEELLKLPNTPGTAPP